MRWYFPSWCGDFRLVAVDDDSCELQIEDPTASEEEALNRFLKIANKEQWTEIAAVDVKDALENGTYRDKPKSGARRQTIALTTDVKEAGKRLVAIIKPTKQSVTGVTFSDGSLEVHESSSSKLIEALSVKSDKEAKVAASVARPTPCCPSCFRDDNVRASEVLDAFLSDQERQRWERERLIEIVGGLSGHRYLLAHRGHPLAQEWTRMCFDLTDGGVMHFHDWSVPAEEEVLAAKLILEHREPWLRNEATCLGWHWTDVFKNPFGSLVDGVKDSHFTAQLGQFFQGLKIGSGALS